MKKATKVSIPTVGELFADGSAIDLIRGNNVAENVALISWDGERATRVPRLEKSGAMYLPLALDPSLLHATRLPAGARSFGTVRKLFGEISALIERTGTSSLAARAVAYFVIATWLPESLPAAPFIWIAAPPTASTAPLRQLLTVLCRRAVLFADLTLSEFRSRPIALRPTIVADLSRPTQGLLAQLRGSNHHGLYRAWNGKLLDGFCPKVIFAREALRDPADAGFPLEITLPPTREHVEILNSGAANEIATEFQAKLQMYRLANFQKIRSPKLDRNGLTVPVQDLAVMLAAPIVGDDHLQSAVLPLLQPIDEGIRVDRAAERDAVVIEALLAVCHDPKVPTGTGRSVTDITLGVNIILAGRGESDHLSPEMVGWRLRGLGVHRQPIEGGLQGVRFDQRTRRAIHALAQSHGVLTWLATSGVAQCAECETCDGQRCQQSA